MPLPRCLRGLRLRVRLRRLRLRLRRPDRPDRLRRIRLVSNFQNFLFYGWGFDWLYDKIFVRPFVWIARVSKRDFIDVIYGGMAASIRLLYGLLSSTETGRVRLYAGGIAAGAIVLIAVVVLL